MEYQVEIIGESNWQEWDHFLIINEVNNPFQSGRLANSMNGNKSLTPVGRILREKDSKKIVGGYFFYIINELKGIFGQFTKRSICIGSPIFFSKDKEIIKLILIDLIERSHKSGIYLEIWHDKFVDFPDVYEELGFKFSEHLNYFIHLEKGQEEIWKNIHKRRKRYINFFTPGLEIKIANSINEFNICYSLLVKAYRRIRLPIFEKEVFLKIFNEKNGVFYLAEKESIPIATRVIIPFNNGYYDWFAGDDRSKGDFHGSDCILWKIFLDGIDQNIRIFNFGGAGRPGEHYGPRDYKATFGGELVNYGRHKFIIDKHADNCINRIIKIHKWLQEKR